MTAPRALTSLRPALATAAALIASLGLSVTAHASTASARPEVLQIAATEGLGTGRLIPTTAALIGLLGVILGTLSLRRSARGIGTGRRGAIVAGLLGLVGFAVGTLHLLNSTGGFGTGNGRAGAIVAMVLCLTSLTLSTLTLSRTRRVTT